MPELKSLFAGPMSGPDADALAAAMKALTHPSRLRILSVLAACGPLTGPRVAVRVPHVSQSVITHHLEILADAELVVRTKHGREVENGLHRAAVAELVALLTPGGSE